MNAAIIEEKCKSLPSTWSFWAFAIGVFAGAIPLHMVLIHQVAAVSDAGFSKNWLHWGSE